MGQPQYFLKFQNIAQACLVELCLGLSLSGLSARKKALISYVELAFITTFCPGFSDAEKKKRNVLPQGLDRLPLWCNKISSRSLSGGLSGPPEAS